MKVPTNLVIDGFDWLSGDKAAGRRFLIGILVLLILVVVVPTLTKQLR